MSESPERRVLVADLQPPASPTHGLQQLSPLSDTSAVVKTFYTPVIARYRSNEDYVVPAIRVEPSMNGSKVSLFPLSKHEIGEIWHDSKELALWSIEVMAGSWPRAEITFRPMVQYSTRFVESIVKGVSDTALYQWFHT